MSEYKLYAVTGNPILFSQSPQIHNHLFRHFNMKAHYTRILSSSAYESLKTGKEMKLHGLNLTSPFKEQAVPFIHEVSSEAEKMKAVNLVLFHNSHMSGFNTDPYGVIKALNANKVSVQGKKCLVLGAGGAGRAAVYGLLKSKAVQVTLVNRTQLKAKKTAHELGCEYAPMEQLVKILADCNIFISCIPRFPCCLNSYKWPPNLNILNANYKNPFSNFPTKQNSINYISGLDWLLFQAFLSFHLFTGKNVPIGIKKSIKEKLMNNRNAHKSNLALIGFMGTGKTSVGQVLAEKKCFNFLDTDQVIEKSEGVCINDIFKKKGEKKFREIEKSLMAQVLQQSKNTVFSLGGGAVLDSHIVKKLRKTCHVIWLWSPLDKIFQRATSKKRPLLSGFSRNHIEQLYLSRIPYYADASDLVVPSPTGEIKQTAQRIKNEIDQTISH